ncbi:MAG: UDP-N-acetylglucosamine 2-epimerase (non-hydrolyzing) [Methanoregula sp.]|jgi:UDP-N-acetylglucosamine 2-epimerase (non-hydrolysing)|nr:UDP-N-acetylglucosamine 2-epimerase (non-hydrolyzing) [Methanoregula sp.]
MKVVSIVGARPQFIKCAPVSHELRKKHEEVLVHTGQHYDPEMSDVFFDELQIPKPDYHLDVGSGSHGKQTGAILERVEDVLMKEKPDLVLVYGDTNSTLAGALAAAKLHIPVAHVEAGLRSFDRTMPEEINRVVTDHVSDILLCPTQTAMDNLAKEGITKGRYKVGDVMVDALRHNAKIAEKKSPVLENLGLIKGDYYVATVHRPGNTDEQKNLTAIIKAFRESGKTVVFPVHPRTKKYLCEYGLWDSLSENIRCIDPLGYIDMLHLMKHAKKILTDSGGIQKEAYVMGVPCITMRENTEWIETLTGGWNVLVGADQFKILAAMKADVHRDVNNTVFGKGDAAKRIVKVIQENCRV